MKTTIDGIREAIENVRALYLKLLNSHCRLGRIDTHGSGVVFLGPQNYIEFRDEEARQLQSRIVRDLGRLLPLVRVLLRGQSETDRGNLDRQEGLLRELLDPNQAIWQDSIATVSGDVSAALDRVVELVAGVYDPLPGTNVFVPDTNALFYNPSLELWRFVGAPRFSLIVVPAVLSELDLLKVNHRTQEVRDKAERLIRTFKGYRARGSILDGVPLVKGISDFAATATEPDFATSLPWLDPSNADDRLLAAALEVMRSRPRSAVTLVTRDMNLQTKAEYARIPFLEPPEPPSAPTAA